MALSLANRAELKTLYNALNDRGLAELPDTTLGFVHGVLVRDPDGHVIELIDR